MCCCAMAIFKKVVVGLCSLLKVFLATAIIVVVTLKLYNVDFKVAGLSNPLHAECLLSGDVRGANVCLYTYAVCGLSLLVSMLLSTLMCFTCNCCGLGGWLEFIVACFQSAWWIIASIVLAKKVKDSNDLGLANEGWRDAVVVMTWTCAALALVTALVCLVDACKCLRECCSCCCRGEDDGDHKSKVMTA
ncbi:hypothetical protein Agub_g10852 [Astrephomene gubernaculifera]|uniref:Transmembrane protein n=1 Tax=Astrephomene gubernaculifera TaxID=47775 RepID=A0AAD3HQ17_9CHLO|nr:hypothetical protein Agub_g10852 [Astrephomene gubernaculifera]